MVDIPRMLPGTQRARRSIEAMAVLAAFAALGTFGIAEAQTASIPLTPAGAPATRPAATTTTQPAAIVLLSAGSAQAPAPAAKPTTTAPAKRSVPDSFAEFAHNLLSRDTLTGNWWGLRGNLDSRGITPSVTLLQAASENFSGGIRTNRIDWRYRLDVSLTLDTQRLFGWKGGTAFVDFMAHGGQNPANDLVGALQAISAIDSNPATRLD